MPNKIRSLFQRLPEYSLSEVDPLFETAICDLPKEIQVAYCKRVIDAALFEIQHNACQEKEKALKKLIRTAKREIKILTC